MEDLIKRLEVEINKTPTGELRNLLCDCNIALYGAKLANSTTKKTCASCVFYNQSCDPCINFSKFIKAN